MPEPVPESVREAEEALARIREQRRGDEEYQAFLADEDARTEEHRRAAEAFTRKADLLQERNKINNELGDLGASWETIYCAFFGGAVGGLLLEHGILIGNRWASSKGDLDGLYFGFSLGASFLVAIAGCILSFEGAIACCNAYSFFAGKWAELRAARSQMRADYHKALGERAKSGDAAALAEIKRLHDEAFAKWRRQRNRRSLSARASAFVKSLRRKPKKVPVPGDDFDFGGGTTSGPNRRLGYGVQAVAGLVIVAAVFWANSEFALEGWPQVGLAGVGFAGLVVFWRGVRPWKKQILMGLGGLLTAVPVVVLLHDQKLPRDNFTWLAVILPGVVGLLLLRKGWKSR